MVLSGNGSATLRNQTLIDHVGDAGFCAPGAALVMTGTGTLTLDHATVSNGPNAAICVGSGGTDVPTVTITQSTISNMAGAAIASNTGVSADAKITANGLTLSGNGRGIDWTSSSAASSLDLSNLTVTGNTYNGITVSNGSLRLRSSTVSGNGQEGGVVLRGSAIAGTFDLGTSAEIRGRRGSDRARRGQHLEGEHPGCRRERPLFDGARLRAGDQIGRNGRRELQHRESIHA